MINTSTCLANSIDFSVYPNMSSPHKPGLSACMSQFPKSVPVLPGPALLLTQLPLQTTQCVLLSERSHTPNTDWQHILERTKPGDGEEVQRCHGLVVWGGLNCKGAWANEGYWQCSPSRVWWWSRSKPLLCIKSHSCAPWRVNSCRGLNACQLGFSRKSFMTWNPNMCCNPYLRKCLLLHCYNYELSCPHEHLRFHWGAVESVSVLSGHELAVCLTVTVSLTWWSMACCNSLSTYLIYTCLVTNLHIYI